MKQCKVREILVRKCVRPYYILCALIIFGICLTYLIYQPAEDNIMHFEENDVIACHYTDDGNALPTTENSYFSPPSNSIFFHETSCKGGLNSREACAVEAAARAHPYRLVYLLFNSPVTKKVLTSSCLEKIAKFKNVRVLRVNIREYAKGTPIEEHIDELLTEGEWPVEHSSDVARILTLYKWGGLYLDLDMLLVRPLTLFPGDWIARESDVSVGTGIMAVSKSKIGRKFIHAIFSEIKANVKLDSWVYKGTRTINKILRKMCRRHKVLQLYWADMCAGFHVYSPKLFYPLHYTQRHWYFHPIDAIPDTRDLEHLHSAYTHHMWNGLTGEYFVDKHSYYSELAKELCPTIYAMYGRRFGI